MASPESDEILIDWDRGLVTDAAGGRTVLRAQSLAVLRELHVRAGSLVTKDELISKIWPGIAVTDDSLVQCIAELRRAFKDVNHTVIKTLTKRGYIFEKRDSLPTHNVKAEPTYITTLETIGRNNLQSETTVPEQSIAVLPFANMSGDAEQEYFTDGLTEDVITDLSNAPGLFVISRNSCFAYKGKPQDIRQIAYDLGVRFILEGSVRKSDQRLRITVQLNDATSGNQLWAERFDRDVADIFALQDEVTAKIVTTIMGKLKQPLSEKLNPSNLAAYDFYMRGRDLWGISGAACAQEVSFLEEALKLDPNYAHALAELGLVQRVQWLIWSTVVDDNSEVVNRLTLKALSLSPRDSHVLLCRAWVALSQGLYEEAGRHYELALTVNPNDADAWLGSGDFYHLTGERDKAVNSIANALRLNPTPPAWYYLIVGVALVSAGKYQQTVDVLSRDIEAHASARRFLAVALAKLGRLAEAREQAKLFIENSPRWQADNFLKKRAYKFQDDRNWWREAYLAAGLPS